jgi:hypothetical protein
MFNNLNINILKKSCVFTLEVIDLYNELILNGKKPIAVRVLSSTINGTCAVQKIVQTENVRELRAQTKIAVTNFKNVIYWINQCEKSGYWFDEQLLRTAIDILQFCENEN